MSSEVCTPGQSIGAAAEFAAGPGTFVRGNHIVSSLVGTKRIVDGEGGKPSLTVSPASGKGTGRLPRPGDVVTGRVLRLAARLALVEVLTIGADPAPARVSGVIRSQDVRTNDVDSVRLPDCFRPGDLVRATVLSLGDARSYFLTTARPDLGVIRALSAATGAPMLPASWREMRCPVSGTIESRKVAKLAAPEA